MCKLPIIDMAKPKNRRNQIVYNSVVQSVRNGMDLGMAANSSVNLLKQDSSKQILRSRHTKQKTALIQSHNHALASPNGNARDENVRLSLPALESNQVRLGQNSMVALPDDESI